MCCLFYRFLLRFVHYRLYGMHEDVLEDSDLPDELLYGRAGYLFAFQFLEYYLEDKSCVDTKVAEKVT